MTEGPRDLRIGVDVGGTKVLGVLLDGRHRVLDRARVPTPQSASDDRGGAPGEEVVEAVAQVIGLLGAPRGCTLGVGAPGMVDHDGMVRFAPNLPGLTGVALRQLLVARFPHHQVAAGNDATCAARAEHLLGAGRGVDQLLMVTLGTGIGGAMIIEGRVVTGASGFAGEIGHMVVDPNGPPCTCGGRGCWERYASGTGLGRMARDAAAAGLLPAAVTLAGGDPEAVRGEHVTEAAGQGDPGALGVLEDVGWWLALGLSNLTAVLDPERIIIGGGLSGAGEALLEPARQAFGSQVEGGSRRPQVTIVGAKLGEEAGAVGAALHALDPATPAMRR